MITIQQIKDYYPEYLKAHQNVWNRRLHFFGQIFTLFYFFYNLFGHHYLLLLLTPFVIYPFAWSGHVFFEKNKPATFNTNPLLTKCCDIYMFYQILTGKIKF